MFLVGGPGPDRLSGAENSDTVYGEEGNDLISSANDTPHSRDRSFGGADADTISADDGNTDVVYGEAGDDEVDAVDLKKDTIDCGAGEADVVHYDEGIDLISNCETLDGVVMITDAVPRSGGQDRTFLLVGGERPRTGSSLSMVLRELIFEAAR